MSTNQQRDKQTKQIRISIKWHSIIKVLAAQTGQTMTAVLEQKLGNLNESENTTVKIHNDQ